jgi:serine phosphatase RsbU (regulator of sigma subunit)
MENDDGIAYGIERLQRTISAAGGGTLCDLVSAVKDDLRLYNKAQPAADDQTMLACATREAQPPKGSNARSFSRANYPTYSP